MPPYRFYYLHNFQQALAWVAERYEDVLDSDERRFLSDFASLPQPSQALMVRMLMRRGPWFRASRLMYEEIPDVAGAAAPWLALGWLDDARPMTVDELFGLHTRPELVRALERLGMPASARKQDLLLAAREAYPEPIPYAEWYPDAPEPAWRVTADGICERFRLMFFGNLHQDWSEFVLADLGVFQYEQVAFEPASRAFQSRADVDCYLALRTCRQSLDEGVEVDALVQAVAACQSDNPWLEQRRAKVLLRIGQACERVQDWPRALRVYGQCRYPGARHRRMRVYERMASFTEAWALSQQALANPESEEEIQRVERMLPRLRRALGTGREVRAAVPAIPRTDLLLPRPETLPWVEGVVRDQWHDDAAPVYYVENTLVGALFGLLCWEAVFAPLPGAFFNPFQRGPADLNAPDFTARREMLFASCLAHLDDGSYRERILQRYDEKQGLQSPFVAWGALTKTLLTQALDCIPATHLKLLFTRLLRDITANRTGLPDLIRFWPEAQRYEMIEVKGPGDRLQDNQIRWMHYCLAHGIPVRVCYVRWEGEADAQLAHAASSPDVMVVPAPGNVAV